MRTLQLHAIEFEYKPVKKALKKGAEEPEQQEFKTSNALIVFTTVEEGDSKEVAEEAAKGIIEHARLVNTSKIVIYPYAHLSSRLASPSKAIKVLKILENKVSSYGFNVHRAVFGWYKEFKIHVAGHPLSELSRSYGVEEKVFVEFNRAFSDKLFNEYTRRFGLEVIEGNVVFDNKWATSSIKLADYLETRCSEVEVHTVTGSLRCVKKYSRACIKTLVQIRPIGALYIDTLLPLDRSTLIKKLNEIFRVGEIKIEDKAIVYESEKIKSTLGFICELENATAVVLLNTTLLTIISSELEALDKGLLPLLPIKIHATPVYIAVAGNVSKFYLERVCNEISKINLEYEVDNSNKRLGEKLRKAGMQWTPIILIVGAREEETNTIVIRERHTGKQYICSINELADNLEKVIDSYEKYRKTTKIKHE